MSARDKMKDQKAEGKTALVDTLHVVIEVTCQTLQKAQGLPPTFLRTYRKWAEKKKILGLPTTSSEDLNTYAHGILHTPSVLSPPLHTWLGTKATVKGFDDHYVRDFWQKLFLALNTYHLSQRPGDELVAQMGSLHDFMQWHG